MPASPHAVHVYMHVHVHLHIVHNCVLGGGGGGGGGEREAGITGTASCPLFLTHHGEGLPRSSLTTAYKHGHGLAMDIV